MALSSLHGMDSQSVKDAMVSKGWLYSLFALSEGRDRMDRMDMGGEGNGLWTEKVVKEEMNRFRLASRLIISCCLRFPYRNSSPPPTSGHFPFGVMVSAIFNNSFLTNYKRTSLLIEDTGEMSQDMFTAGSTA